MTLVKLSLQDKFVLDCLQVAPFQHKGYLEMCLNVFFVPRIFLRSIPTTLVLRFGDDWLSGFFQKVF